MGNAKNEAGKRYGFWTVIKRIENQGIHAMWLCECDCGITKPVSGSNLRNGTSKSCGCAKRRYTPVKEGSRYGKWVVLEKAKDGRCRVKRWLCKCDCGTQRTVAAARLVTGQSVSCGCSRFGVPYVKTTKENTFIEKAFYSCRKSAKKRGIEFSLTRLEFSDLSGGNCYYCGIQPTERTISGKTGKCNGIDRKDSDMGYVIDNCVSCCTTCNVAKNTMTVDGFYAWVSRVYTHVFNV